MNMDDCYKRIWNGTELHTDAPPGTYRRCMRDGSAMVDRQRWHFVKVAPKQLYWLDRKDKKFMEPIRPNWNFMTYRRVKEVK